MWSEILREDPVRFRRELIIFACDPAQPWPDRTKAFRILQGGAKILGIVGESSVVDSLSIMSLNEFPPARLEQLILQGEEESSSDWIILLNLIMLVEEVAPKHRAKEFLKIEAALKLSPIGDIVESILKRMRDKENGNT